MLIIQRLIILFYVFTNVAMGFYNQVLNRPASAASFTDAIIGDKLAFIYEYSNFYSVHEYNYKTGGFDNVTTASFTISEFESPPIIIYGMLVRCTYDHVVVGYMVDNGNTNFHLFRALWDPVTKTFGSFSYSSSNGNRNVMEQWSPDCKFVLEEDYNNLLIRTRYWNGMAWAIATPISYTLNSLSYYTMNDYLVISLTSWNSNTPLYTRGKAEIRSWNGIDWGPVEHTFYAPARNSELTHVWGFGKNGWVTDTFAIFYAPDSSNVDNNYNQNAGCYVTFKKIGGIWTYQSIVFPNEYSANYRAGKIIFLSNNYAVVEGSGSLSSSYSNLRIFRADGSNFQMTTTVQYSNSESSKIGDRVFYTYNSNSVTFINIKAPANEPVGLQRITPPIEVTNAYFGLLSVVVGNVLATCTYNEKLNGDVTGGALRIYTRNVETGIWTFADEIGPGNVDGQSSINFCLYSMDFDGSSVIVGAINENGAGISRGAAYVYNWDGSSLTLNTKLQNPVQENYAQFGYAVSIKNNVIVIGARSQDTVASNAGAAYVFTKSGGTWDTGATLPFPTGGDVLTSNNYFGEYVHTDGVTIIASTTYPGASQPKGMVAVYKLDGGSWVIDTILKGQTGTNTFGYNARVSGDFIVTTASNGKLHVFEKLGGTWGFKEMITYPNNPIVGESPGVSRSTIDMEGSIIVVGRPSDDWWGPYTGSVELFIYDGTSWNNDHRTIRIDDGNYYNSLAKSSVSTDGSSLTFSDDYYNGVLTSSGRLLEYAVFKACTASSQCALGNYCSPGLVCVSAKACGGHADCIGEFGAGRLPYCNFTSGECRDVYTGSCTSVSTCNLIHKKLNMFRNKLGSIKQDVTITNTTKARETVQKLYTYLKNTTTITQNLDIFVYGKETATFDSNLFTDYGNDAALLAYIKSVVCPPEVLDLCDIEIPSERRLDSRNLQSSSSITVEITFSIDSDLFDSLAANGTSFSDGSDFEQALATLLGVSTEDIVLSAVSGELVIEYMVTQEAIGKDPLTEENLAALQEVQNDLAGITSTVISALGLGGNDIQSQSIDYCTNRTCNDRGTCDSVTGVCKCNDPAYWGVNCETYVDCNNGVKDPAYAYCICEYPEYGQRCESTLDCSC